MMSAPAARTSAGFIALPVAAVPTGMNAGVRISPRRMAMTPVRAAPSVAAVEKAKRGRESIFSPLARRRPPRKALDNGRERRDGVPPLRGDETWPRDRCAATRKRESRRKRGRRRWPPIPRPRAGRRKADGGAVRPPPPAVEAGGDPEAPPARPQG